MSGRIEKSERTLNFSFVSDPISRRVMRTLFLVQLGSMIVVVFLSLRHMYLPAITLSIVNLIVLGLTLLWLYARYQQFPVIREKYDLEHLMSKFQKGIQTEEKIIQAAVRQRADLYQAEKAEIQSALRVLQKNHIERGLLLASIHEADIPALGPDLKRHLAGYGVACATDITDRIASIKDLGEAERQALLDWRTGVLQELDSTKPVNLGERELEAIQRKYRTLQDQNNIANRNALASRQMLEYEVISFRERLQQIASFTFMRYLSRSLASRGMLATPLALALVMAQVVSSVSAMAASIVVLIPVTGDLVSSTAVPTNIEIITSTVVPSVTLSSTPLPSVTAPTLPSATIPATQTPLASAPVVPSQTALIPVSGNCDPSYPGVCIPPAPPDLDCKDVTDRRFQVLQPDPHNFDRDGDGIGCE